MKQLSLFSSSAYRTPDEFIRGDNWDAEIVSEKGKLLVVLYSPDGPSKTYRWPNPSTEQVKALILWAEKLRDFPDLVSCGGHPDTIYSVYPLAAGGGDRTKCSEKQQPSQSNSRTQTGWIQTSYRIRVHGKQMSIRHWQPGATGPYYCYRYKSNGKTTGIYLRGDRYNEILAAINAGKSVVEILEMLS